MKKTFVSKIILIFALFSGLVSNAQAKKWTLQECVQYALDNNISIKQADLDSQVAEIDKKDAFGNFLPSINGTAVHSWNIGLNQNITTGLLENQTVQFTSAGLNANIDIYKGLQNINRMKKARLSMIAAQYKLTKMKDDISLNVANAFLQILFNKENLKVQKEQLQNNEKQKERTKALVDAGSVPRGDLLDIDATVASSQQSVIVAENTLLISKLSLAQLLQIENFQEFDIQDNDYEVRESEVMLQAPSAIFEKAKAERSELKIAKANLEIAEKDVQIARGAYQPSLQGFYSFSTRASYSDRIVDYNLNSQNPTRVIGVVEGTNQNVVTPNLSPILGKPAPIFDQFSDNKGHSFGFQLNIPILNGLSARNNVARTKVALERSRTLYSQQELDLERNVYTAFTDAKGALKSYESALVALEARTEAFNYAKEKFDVGLMNAFELNQAQTLYVNAQSEVLRTKFDYIFRVKVLEFYFGIPIQKQ
ncbi:TolC family protein [Flavobacterium microcysteis]|uniref:TolC family protein n=1 Tax=Flavobacterium microcysteis TaxID=2596891 RepID=A0A501PZC9_9FLAO|nr:TolC family protein [Flavobacterium microcysteis]TPD65538.1 TolC family protein [Flavobacterium microcysteis]